MNTLQALPPGAKSAPSVPTTGKAPAGEASPFAKTAPAASPIIGPSGLSKVDSESIPANNGVTGGTKPLVPPAAEQLADAREANVQAAEERKARAERAAEAAKKAEAKQQAAPESGGLERKVGFIEGTTEVFVDLVDPVREKSVFRIFGPEDGHEHQEPEQPQPTQPQNPAATAYTRTGSPRVLKDVGVA